MTKIDEAIVFATMAHKGDCRKGTQLPYISHPYAVAMLLQQAGCGEDVIIAGLLHDTVEDTDVTLDDVEQRFGQRVADLVAAASEPDKSATWEARKQHTIDFVATAPLDAKYLSCADKLHNLRSILADLERDGPAVWRRFQRGRDDQTWYYTEMSSSFVHGLSPEQQAHPLFTAYQQEITELHRAVAAENAQ